MDGQFRRSMRDHPSRPTLLPSRNNSRPDLARYTTSSSLSSDRGRGRVVVGGGGGGVGGGGGGVCNDFEERRELLLERIMKLENACGDITEQQQGQEQGRGRGQGEQQEQGRGQGEQQGRGRGQGEQQEQGVDDRLDVFVERRNDGYSSVNHIGPRVDGQTTVWTSAYNYVDLTQSTSSSSSVDSRGVGGGGKAPDPLLLCNNANLQIQRLDQFHRLLSEIRSARGDDNASLQTRLDVYDRLVTMTSEFQHLCEAYAKVIILEYHLPDEKKTIKPLRSGGILGGDKYCVNGIYVKFSRDKQGLFGGSQEAAAKVALHEVKSLNAVINAAIPDLRFPLMSVISHLGYTLICMSVLPIDSSTLRYGSADAGKTITFGDAKCMELANALGEKLNLRAHSPKGHPEISVRLPMDIEIHLGFDGHYYMLDFSRLFPCVPLVKNQSPKGAQFTRLFRAELLATHPVALNPDAFSGFTDSDDQIVSIREVVEAEKRLNSEIERFGKQLSERSVPPHAIDKEHALAVLSVRLHIAAINTRYLGAVRGHCTSPYWRLMLLIGMLSRRLARLVEEALRKSHSSSTGDPSRSNTKAFIEFVNMVFGNSEESVPFWTDTLLPSCISYFGPLDDVVMDCNVKDHIFSEGNDTILGEPVVLRLLREFLKKINMELNERTIGHYYNNPRSLNVTHPFDAADVLGLSLTVSHLPIIFFVSAKVKRCLAMTSSGSRQFHLYQSAAQLFFKALHGYPSDSVGLRNIATCLSFLGEQDAALEYFNLSLQCSGGNSELRSQTHFKMANFYDSLFDVERAEDHYLMCVEESEVPSVSRLSTYADFLFQHGHHEWAIRIYRAVLHINPRYAEAMHNLGVVLSTRGDPEAGQYFDRALKHCPDERSRARIVHNAAVFWSSCDDSRATELWKSCEQHATMLESMQGPLLYHCTNSKSEITEVKNIIGPKHIYKVRQLRLNYARFGLTKEGISPQAAAFEKITLIADLVRAAVSTEIVYLSFDQGRVIIFGSSFQALGVDAFSQRYLGQQVRCGVVVALHTGERVRTYESWVDGTVCTPVGQGFGWDRCIRLTEFGKTLSEIDDPYLKASISFRRLSWLKLWVENFVGAKE